MRGRLGGMCLEGAFTNYYKGISWAYGRLALGMERGKILTMTPDERLDRLTERHEALAESLQLLTADVQSLAQSTKELRESTKELRHLAEDVIWRRGVER